MIRELLIASQPTLCNLYIPTGMGPLDLCLAVLAARRHLRSVDQGIFVQVKSC
jgi:hypothetical protein